MIDLLRIAIPFDEAFVAGGFSANGKLSGLVDLKECNLRGARLESGSVIFNDGTFEVDSLRHPYESLPSSWSTLSFKIHAGGSTYWPFIEIKASPAKLLTGHNVFGTDDVRVSIESLVTAFNLGMPALAEMLDFYSAEIKQIDCTFSAQVGSDSAARTAIQTLKNVSSGQTRASKSSHDTTAYWGVKNSNAGKSNSRHKQLKAYLKKYELENAILETEKKLKKTEQTVYQSQLDAMKSKPVQDFARFALRLEASVLPRMLKRLGFPTRIGDFVAHCEKMKLKHCPIEYLWHMAWTDILSTFEGLEVNIYNDDEVRKVLQQEFSRVTAKGKISDSKANRLFRFFRGLKHEGWEEVKRTTPESTFFDNVKELSTVIPKSQLQNLQSDASNVVPLVRFVNVDFANQHPENWQEPKPLHIQLREGLRLVS